MITYQLQGVIHPRRAQIQDHSVRVKGRHFSTGNAISLRGRILLNELSAWVETPDQWDIFDLRNMVRYMMQTDLALVGFLNGCAYSVEVVRVICAALEIDQVYGIDIPCIANRERKVALGVAIQHLKQLCVGKSGIYLQRCMNDLLLAMQHPEDTAFFCYRAIEGLKTHAMERLANPPRNASTQWAYFREAAGCTREQIDSIKRDADRQRHSADLLTVEADRETVFTQSWNIVEGYISSLSAQKTDAKP